MSIHESKSVSCFTQVLLQALGETLVVVLKKFKKSARFLSRIILVHDKKMWRKVVDNACCLLSKLKNIDCNSIEAATYNNMYCISSYKTCGYQGPHWRGVRAQARQDPYNGGAPPLPPPPSIFSKSW